MQVRTFTLPVFACCFYLRKEKVYYLLDCYPVQAVYSSPDSNGPGQAFYLKLNWASHWKPRKAVVHRKLIPLHFIKFLGLKFPFWWKKTEGRHQPLGGLPVWSLAFSIFTSTSFQWGFHGSVCLTGVSASSRKVWGVSRPSYWWQSWFVGAG